MDEARGVEVARLVGRVHAMTNGLVPLPADEVLVPTVRGLVRECAPLLDEGSCTRVVDEVVARLRGLGPLEALLADPTVTDVLVNGDGTVWTERLGELRREPVDLGEELRLALIERIVNPLGLRVDRASPVVDARLADGSRVHAVVRPLAVDGPCLSIRRFAATSHPVEAYCAPAVAALLASSVSERRNILVSGGTGAGKTSFLNALAACIPTDERLITVEDAAELRLGREHVVRLESRPANAEGVGEVTIRDLVRTALRMRPDRIIVGEVRGPEALDMLQAMNTGHEGSLSTCHANSPVDALRRIETMVLMGAVPLPSSALRTQICASLDLVVQVARRPDGGRRVVAVDEVVASEDRLATRPLLSPEGDRCALPGRPARRAVASSVEPSC